MESRKESIILSGFEAVSALQKVLFIIIYEGICIAGFE